MVGDFNLEPSHVCRETCVETINFLILMKNNTCFKRSGSCIDLILTNRKYCFQGTSSFETGLRDYHHLIYSIVKRTPEPKQVIYRNHKHIHRKHFENILKSSLNNCNANFDEYEKTFTTALSLHAPKKVKKF